MHTFFQLYLVCSASPLSTLHYGVLDNRWLALSQDVSLKRVRIDYCVSELTLQKSKSWCWSRHRRHLIKMACSRPDIAEKMCAF
jgi:hypothetical protein